MKQATIDRLAKQVCKNVNEEWRGRWRHAFGLDVQRALFARASLEIAGGVDESTPMSKDDVIKVYERALELALVRD